MKLGGVYPFLAIDVCYSRGIVTAYQHMMPLEAVQEMLQSLP